LPAGKSCTCFSRYLGNVITAFYRDPSRDVPSPENRRDLPTLLTPSEFDGLLKQFAAGVFCKLLQGKPARSWRSRRRPITCCTCTTFDICSRR
jgi:hypothetical protein